MKNILLLFFVTSLNFTFGQSSFSDGFNSGYKEGYCFNKGINCVEPISPVAPQPTVNENINNYQDGYNRGFEVGLNITKSTTTNFENYKTSSPKYIEYMRSLNNKDLNSIIQILKEAKQKALQSLTDKEYNKTIQISLAGLRLSPKDSEFMFMIGMSYFQTNDITNALKWLKKSYSFNPKDLNLRDFINEIETN